LLEDRDEHLLPVIAATRASVMTLLGYRLGATAAGTAVAWRSACRWPESCIPMVLPEWWAWSWLPARSVPCPRWPWLLWQATACKA